ASVIVSAQILEIAAGIINAGTFNASNGTIELNGATAQNISANTFMNNSVYNLIITNSAGVTLSGDVDVYNSLTYGKNGSILNTGGFLTLKSTVTQTAYIGDMTNHTINGDVTVERYIATGTASPNHPKSWQFLAIPTQGQTIHQSWQENCSVNGNCNSGFGT